MYILFGSTFPLACVEDRNFPGMLLSSATQAKFRNASSRIARLIVLFKTYTMILKPLSHVAPKTMYLNQVQLLTYTLDSTGNSPSQVPLTPLNYDS